MDRFCKKCLLMEAGESAVFETVRDYIKNLDTETKVSEEIYHRRLHLCRSCEMLISGMCRKCGCYVEVRAALKDQHCPDFDHRRW